MSNTEQMFEKAIRGKYRFETNTGSILSSEDLYDIALDSQTKPSLNGIAKRLHKSIQELNEESFVSTRSTASKELQEKLDLVIHIINSRMAEQETAKLARERAEMKRKLLEIHAQKKENDLLSKSTEELEKMIKDLG